jgi:hypothetical protein
MSLRYKSLRDMIVRNSKCCCLRGFFLRYAHLTNETLAEEKRVTVRSIYYWKALSRNPDYWCVECLRTLGPGVLDSVLAAVQGVVPPSPKPPSLPEP